MALDSRTTHGRWSHCRRGAANAAPVQDLRTSERSGSASAIVPRWLTGSCRCSSYTALHTWRLGRTDPFSRRSGRPLSWSESGNPDQSCIWNPSLEACFGAPTFCNCHLITRALTLSQPSMLRSMFPSLRQLTSKWSADKSRVY